MSDGDKCDLPKAGPADEETAVGRMLTGRRIAVVGLSDNPRRPSYDVARYMQSAGYEVIPVNPNHAEVLGRPCYASLAGVPGPIDVVNVFRRSELCADVAREAIAAGAKGIWLQSGIESEEAKKIATEAGVDFVQDRCIKVEHYFRKRQR